MPFSDPFAEPPPIPAYAGLSDAERRHLKNWLIEDCRSEYDARLFSTHLRAALAPLSDAFEHFLKGWDVDEDRHYRGFSKLRRACLAGDGAASATEDDVLAAMGSRHPDFLPVAAFLEDEFSVALLLAYDELLSVWAYRAEFAFYDRLGSAEISRWIRAVTRDEARHYAGALALARRDLPTRVAEAETLLDAFVAYEAEEQPYAATFVLERGSDPDSASREMGPKARDVILRHLHKPESDPIADLASPDSAETAA